jgi:hypothetical protein
MFYFDYMDVTTENEHGDLTSSIAFYAGLLLVRFITKNITMAAKSISLPRTTSVSLMARRLCTWLPPSSRCKGRALSSCVH